MTGKTNAMRILEKAGVPYEPVTYGAREALDAVSVAALVGVDPRFVYKTLVTEGSDREHYVCVIPAPDELDLKAAAARLGIRSLRMAPADELKGLTGYVRGGCSPIGMKKPLRTLLDRSAAELPFLLVSGGRIGLQLRLAPEDLRRACLAEYAGIIA